MSESEMAARMLADYDYDSSYSEMQYHHYGNRGAVDLVLTYLENDPVRGCDVSVYELKSDSAIRQATGANEIARQFTHQQEYFERGQDQFNSPPDYLYHFLLFDYSEFAVNHVWDNKDLYLSACGDRAGVHIYLPSGVYARLRDTGFHVRRGYAHEIDALGMPDAGVWEKVDHE